MSLTSYQAAAPPRDFEERYTALVAAFAIGKTMCSVFIKTPWDQGVGQIVSPAMGPGITSNAVLMMASATMARLRLAIE